MPDVPVRGISIPFRFEGGLALSEGDARLRENLVAVLLTNPGERPMRRGFGAGLSALRHEPLDAATLALARRQIAATLAEAEPRIQIRALELEADPAGAILFVNLRWAVRATGEPGELRVPLPWSHP